MGKQRETRSGVVKRRQADQAVEPLQPDKQTKKAKKEAAPQQQKGKKEPAAPQEKGKKDQKAAKKASKEPKQQQQKADQEPKKRSRTKKQQEQEQLGPDKSVHDQFMDELHAKEQELNKHCLIMGQVSRAAGLDC
jgi:hypothetical protein